MHGSICFASGRIWGSGAEHNQVRSSLSAGRESGQVNRSQAFTFSHARGATDEAHPDPASRRRRSANAQGTAQKGHAY